ncbi:putative Enhancer of rudimentary-like protein [Hypsibius exemplaris]|uniref:Enhancer of rudimentary-like protein n=1 Tax=Hypsibius exemplaris TaxID=2072580 RepID=A0A9X6NI47_HYPEX|nr:putative Enhancer of rudimentary-like protein [Hypsibius exemplaris]
MAHTILLLQTTANPASRTYCDYENEDECLEGICRIFELNLRKSMPGEGSITYDIRDLYDFIDRLEDICVMVSQEARGSQLYLPRGKQFIKEAIYELLLRVRNKQP